MTLAAPAELRQAGIRPALPGLALPAGLGLPALVLLCATLFGALPFLRLLAAAFAPGWQFAPEGALAEITSRAAVNATLQGPLSLEATRQDLDARGKAQIKANSVNKA